MSLLNCGGVPKEAKIATLIQTLMANSLTSFASKDPNSLEILYNCGTSSDEGTISYRLPIDNEDLKNPLKLIEFLQNNPTFTAFEVTFTQCRVQACGSPLTLDGSAALGLGISAQELINKKIPARFSLSSSDLKASGFLNGSLSFSYVIEATYTRDSLDSIEIKEADPARPLSWDGKIYHAADISDLSDGC